MSHHNFLFISSRCDGYDKAEEENKTPNQADLAFRLVLATYFVTFF